MKVLRNRGGVGGGGNQGEMRARRVVMKWRGGMEQKGGAERQVQ